MASPHVAGIVALMVEKDPGLTAPQVEAMLLGSALPIGAGSRDVWDPFLDTPAFTTIAWGADATGAGLVQADGAIAAMS